MTIRPDDAGFSSEAEKGILGKVGGIASKAAGVFAAGFVAKQGFDFLGGLVKDASESRRVLAETEQAIKATGGAAGISAKEVAALADSLSKKTGIDDEQIQSAENLLLTFKSVRNEAGKGNDVFNQATKAVLDLSKQFGGTEASAVQIGKALNDPIQGVTALTRVGVQFTDQQKEQIKAMVEVGDTLGAQKIILGEINSQVGGQAEAQATAAAKLKVVWGNLREELGARLLPIVDKVATFLADKLPGALDKGTAVFSIFFRKVKDVVQGLFDLLGRGDFTGAFRRAFNVEEDSPIVAVILRIRAAVIELGERFADLARFVMDHSKVIVEALTSIAVAFVVIKTASAIGGIITTVTAIVSALSAAVASAGGLGAALLALTGPVGLIVLAVAALAAGVVLAYQRFQGFRDFVNAAVKAVVSFVTEQFANLQNFVRENWAGIQEAIGHVIVVVQAIIEDFIGIVQAIWRAWGDELLNIVRIVWDQIRNVIDTVIGIISGLIRAGVAIINGDWGAAWDAIKDILSTAWDFIKTTVENALRLLREVIEGAISGIVEFFGGVPGQIRDKLESLVGFLADVGTRAVRAMADAIGNAIGWVLDKAGDLVNKVKDKLTFWDSPPELFGLHVGQRLVRGMAEGLADTNPAKAAAERLVGVVKDQFNSAGRWIDEWNAEQGQMERIFYPTNARDDFGRPFFVSPLTGKVTSTGDPNARFNDATQAPGAGNGTMILSITGPLVNVEGSVIPGQEEELGRVAEQAVINMVRNGTVGREMSNRTMIISRR